MSGGAGREIARYGGAGVDNSERGLSRGVEKRGTCTLCSLAM